MSECERERERERERVRVRVSECECVQSVTVAVVNLCLEFSLRGTWKCYIAADIFREHNLTLVGTARALRLTY